MLCRDYRNCFKNNNVFTKRPLGKHRHIMNVLGSYRVKNAPDTVYYIPNFITEDEETHILKMVYNAPKPKWTCLRNRRLQDYGGIPHPNGLIPEPIPSWLTTFMTRISDLRIFGDGTANHCLVNEYIPGQGIMPHLDGPTFYPTVSTISCGSHTILEFADLNDNSGRACDLLLERRSLVIVQKEMYTAHMHSISEIKEDVLTDRCVNVDNCSVKYEVGDVLKRDTRISLTIRYVPKVAKHNLHKFLMQKKS